MQLKVLFLLIIVYFLPVSLQSQIPGSKGITPQFLEIVGKFSEWPSEDLTTSKPFVIGIYGELLNNKLFEEHFSKNSINKRKVEIRYLSNLNNLLEVDLLYVSKSKEKDIEKILTLVKNQAILTISDAPGFAEKGIIFNYVNENTKTVYQVNQKAASSSKVIIRYNLYEGAEIINPTQTLPSTQKNK